MFPASNKIGFTPPILASPSGEATIRDPELHAGGVEPPARSLLVEQLAGNRALIGRPFRPEDEGQVTFPTPSTSQRCALRLGLAARAAFAGRRRAQTAARTESFTNNGSENVFNESPSPAT